MNVALLDRTIREMCDEVELHNRSTPGWRELDDARLVFEAMICIIGSQTRYEVASAVAERLCERGLCQPALQFDARSYHQAVLAALSEPVQVKAGSATTHVARIRFRNRLAGLLTRNAAQAWLHGRTLRAMLESSDGASDARMRLVRNVCGLGPKQASLFLRRISYCSDLAVLDVHVLDYLRVARGVMVKTSSLGRLQSYERVEDQFRAVAAEFGYPVGCVDLATWITIRVAKREALL
jgi:N-glycosylase/DNA lyase